MGKNEDKILRTLKQLAQNPDETFIAIVSDNHPDDDFIDVKDLLDVEYNNVRKRAAIDGKKGLQITPVKNTTVLVSRIGGSDSLYVAMVSEIEKVKIEIEDITYEMTKDKFEFNGGSLGGLIKIENLISRLNAIEDAHNNLLTEYKTHVHSGVLSGVGSSGTMVPPSTQQNAEKSKRDPLEDKKVTH